MAWTQDHLEQTADYIMTGYRRDKDWVPGPHETYMLKQGWNNPETLDRARHLDWYDKAHANLHKIPKEHQREFLHWCGIANVPNRAVLVKNLKGTLSPRVSLPNGLDLFPEGKPKVLTLDEAAELRRMRHSPNNPSNTRHTWDTAGVERFVDAVREQANATPYNALPPNELHEWVEWELRQARASSETRLEVCTRLGWDIAHLHKAAQRLEQAREQHVHDNIAKTLPDVPTLSTYDRRTPTRSR